MLAGCSPLYVDPPVACNRVDKEKLGFHLHPRGGHGSMGMPPTLSGMGSQEYCVASSLMHLAFEQC